MSFKEKYLRLRERFDRVSATQRQYTTDLQSARNKTRRLKDENNHLLDLLSDIQQMTGSGPTTDSDTSMDDLSDDDDDEDDDDVMRPRAPTDSRTNNTATGRSTTTPSAKSRKDNNQTGYEGNGHAEGGRDNGQRSNHNGNYSHQDHRRDVHLQQDPMQYHQQQPQQHLQLQHQQQQLQQQSITASSTVNNGSSNMKQERADGEAAPKQTRRATKRADRGRPRAVVPLKTNPDGSLNYPIVVGRGTNEVIIENMGRIVWNGRGYHNHRYIFPVGFRSKKQYTSLSDTSKKTYFISEILDGGEQPIFQITLEDMPEKVFQHSSSSGAWELALKGLMELGFNAKTHASGPDMYGLTNLGVIKYIQEMPNAHRCRRYMPLKWIVDEEDDNADSSSHAGSVGPGSKSPGRKKKINNSLYASNHEVLVSTMEEARNREGRNNDHLAPKPYQVRKYTKRKTNPSPPVPSTDPFMATAASSLQATPSSLVPRDRGGYRDEGQQSVSWIIKQESNMDHTAASSSNMAYSDRLYLEPQRVPLLSPSHKESPHHHHHHHHHHDQHYRSQHRTHPHDSSIHEP